MVVALSVIAAAAGCLVASGSSWFAVPDGTGGTTRISGWGTVTGGQISGGNINDLGQVGFRPGGLAVVVGGLALLAGLGIASVGKGRRPHRIPAVLLAFCGLTGLCWGVVRARWPGTLGGAYSAAEVSGGTGPPLLAGCSLVLLAAAVAVFTGLLDPPPPPARRGRLRNVPGDEGR